ncbi:MAG: hypothetical protein A4E66_01311 [Syntrophus sp. PtaB.Bin001]|nr:MAG: hypothetical protein A4E66_01311 [Syntrophus sp. PtaB.Bin001]
MRPYICSEGIVGKSGSEGFVDNNGIFRLESGKDLTNLIRSQCTFRKTRISQRSDNIFFTSRVNRSIQLISQAIQRLRFVLMICADMYTTLFIVQKKARHVFITEKCHRFP